MKGRKRPGRVTLTPAQSAAWKAIVAAQTARTPPGFVSYGVGHLIQASKRRRMKP